MKVQILPAIETQDLTQDMFRYIFRRISPPPKKKKFKSKRKKDSFCHLSCELIGLKNINVWPKTAGMISFLLLTLDGHFKTPSIVLLMLHFSGLVLMGINWQIRPSGRRETNAFCFYKCSLLTLWLVCHGHFKDEVIQRWIFNSFCGNDKFLLLLKIVLRN